MNQSEELKCKAIVIDRNGKAYYMQSMDEGLYHGEALLAYIKEKYPEAHEFDDLEVDSNRTIFAYRLGLYGDAVYYNVGSSGVIYLPNDVTDEQIDTIYNFDLGNQIIELGYNPEYYGFPCYKTIGMGGSLTLKEVMDRYILVKNEEANLRNEHTR